MKKIPLNKKIFNPWIKALESKNYHQGKSKLCTKFANDESDNNYKYCCLGVAVEVFGPKAKKLVQLEGRISYPSYFENDIFINRLSEKEKKLIIEFNLFLSLDTGYGDNSLCNDIVLLLQEKNKQDQFYSFRNSSISFVLSSLNDHRNYSFQQIADFLKEIVEPV
jgi:hypothetical protein